MNLPDLKYSKEHEWVRLETESIGVIGITQFASDSLGDVVFVELPEVGAKLIQFEKMGEIESVKAVSDLYSPVSGNVLECNEILMDSPESVNEEPYNTGWLVKIALTGDSGMEKLMSSDQYQAFLDVQE